jgi:uroporphyrinogen decarboxylase
MTRKELVRAAISHREVGRIPYFINFTRDAAEIVRTHLGETDIHRAIGNSVYPVFPPWWKWQDVPASYRGWDAPEVLPRTRGYGSYAATEEQIATVAKETDCYILAMFYGSHFEKAYFARGIENFLADLAANQEYAKRLLDQIIRKNLVMLENILSIPEIDGVLLGSDWGSQKGLLMSPSIWRELIAPGEKVEYDLIHSYGKDVWVHSCGDITEIVGDLVDMGLDVLNPVQPECMDIAFLKREYGKDLTFWGGIGTQQVLPFGKPAEVRAEVDRVVELMSRGGGYITSPAQEIQHDVPLDNIIALIDQARTKA